MSIHLDDLGPSAEQRELEAVEAFKEWQRLLVIKCAISEENQITQSDPDPDDYMDPRVGSGRDF